MEFLKNIFKNTRNSKVDEKGNTMKINQTIIDFKNKKKDNFHECVICLEEMKNDEKVSLLVCSHMFHTDCIHLWAERKRLCPLCDQSF